MALPHAKGVVASGVRLCSKMNAGVPMQQIFQDDLVTLQWHLVLCKPNQHNIAKRALAHLNCEVFLPLQERQRRWRGRLLSDLRPVFPGYLFVGIDPRRPLWREVQNSYGVSRIVGFGERGLAVVPGGVVAGLMARCDPTGILRPIEESFAAGDRIRIVSGAFANFVTEIDKIDPDRRLHVLLDLLGRPTRVVLEPHLARREA